jgi:hypothetical protein
MVRTRLLDGIRHELDLFHGRANEKRDAAVGAAAGEG